MRSNASRTPATAVWAAADEERAEARAQPSSAEQGRRAILAGWVMTMLGIVAYIVAMSRAGESAGIVDAITGQGFVGWLSAALMLGGVGVWFIGNLACLRAMAEVPGEGED